MRSLRVGMGNCWMGNWLRGVGSDIPRDEQTMNGTAAGEKATNTPAADFLLRACSSTIIPHTLICRAGPATHTTHTIQQHKTRYIFLLSLAILYEQRWREGRGQRRYGEMIMNGRI